MIDNFFLRTEEENFDRRFGKVPSRDEIRRCISPGKYTRRAEEPLRSKAEFDFRKWEMDVLPNIYENVTVKGLYNTSSSQYCLVAKYYSNGSEGL